MKKILVTGANGQLGNEMRLLAEEHRNFEYFFTDVAELDICDEQAVMEFVSAHQIDVIVNPFIVELRAKGGDKDVPELETCFDAMYGVLMLKLQKKEISEETMKAVKAISDLLAMLAGYYIKDKEGDLELD